MALKGNWPCCGLHKTPDSGGKQHGKPRSCVLGPTHGTQIRGHRAGNRGLGGQANGSACRDKAMSAGAHPTSVGHSRFYWAMDGPLATHREHSCPFFCTKAAFLCSQRRSPHALYLCHMQHRVFPDLRLRMGHTLCRENDGRIIPFRL
jgi:hypothetical protein